MTSLTCASDWPRSMASPSANATISIAAFSSSVHARSTQAVVDGQRAPDIAVREDRDRQERLDLLVLEILAQEAFDVAGQAGEHLALPTFAGDPLEQRIGMDDRLDDHGRRGGRADHAFIDPVGRDRLGQALAGQFAQAGTGWRGGRKASGRAVSRMPSTSGCQSIAWRSRRTMRAAATVGLIVSGVGPAPGDVVSVSSKRSVPLLRGAPDGHAQRSALSSPGSEKI